jgi:hypothetical protein
MTSGRLDSEKNLRKLGIKRTWKILTSEPDYVTISLGWYRKFEETGSNDALFMTRHYITVAREMGQLEADPEITLEFLLEK